MHGAARLLSAYASAFSSGEANRVRLRSGELRTTGHTRARGRAREAKRSLTAAAGEFPSCVAIWRKGDKSFWCRGGPVGRGFEVLRGEGRAAHCRPSALDNPGPPLPVRKTDLRVARLRVTTAQIALTASPRAKSGVLGKPNFESLNRGSREDGVGLPVVASSPAKPSPANARTVRCSQFLDYCAVPPVTPEVAGSSPVAPALYRALASAA
jgi:hypothetical protein